jgi:tetratricopeptide (TPR) repeat protein
MSRAWLPRRIRAGIPALVVCVAAALAPSAWAQRGNESRAVTIIGGDAYAQRCMAEVGSGLFGDETLATCTRALRNPRLAEDSEILLMVNRGVVLLRRGENEAALTQFDAVLEEDDEHAEAHLNRAAALVQLSRYGEAIAEITAALGLGVTEPHKAYFNRGIAREQLGDLRGAYDDYRTALEIQPDWGPANAELARFARTRRDTLASRLGEPGQQ